MASRSPSPATLDGVGSQALLVLRLPGQEGDVEGLGDGDDHSLCLGAVGRLHDVNAHVPCVVVSGDERKRFVVLGVRAAVRDGVHGHVVDQLLRRHVLQPQTLIGDLDGEAAEGALLALVDSDHRAIVQLDPFARRLG